MRSAIDIVNDYYLAFGQRDAGKLRAALAKNFTFKGPLMSFDDPAAFVEAMVNMPFEATSEDSRFIVDGNRVAHVFLWKMSAPVAAEIPMCEVLEIAGGRIRRSDLFYDSKLFPMGGADGRK